MKGISTSHRERSESAGWLVIMDDGAAVPLHLRLDLWSRGQGLVSSDGQVFDYRDLVEQALKKRQQFAAGLKANQRSMEALCTFIAITCSPSVLKGLPQPAEGKALVAAIENGASLAQIQANATSVVDVNLRGSSLKLIEYFLAKLFLGARHDSAASNTVRDPLLERAETEAAPNVETGG